MFQRFGKRQSKETTEAMSIDAVAADKQDANKKNQNVKKNILANNDAVRCVCCEEVGLWMILRTEFSQKNCVQCASIKVGTWIY